MALICPRCKSDSCQPLAWLDQCLSCGAHFDDRGHLYDTDYPQEELPPQEQGDVSEEPAPAPSIEEVPAPEPAPAPPEEVPDGEAQPEGAAG